MDGDPSLTDPPAELSPSSAVSWNVPYEGDGDMGMLREAVFMIAALYSSSFVSPIETLQHASLEAECWRKANEKDEANEDHDDPSTTEVETVPLGYPESLLVQLIRHGPIMAVNLLDLHVEMEGLLWAASYIRDKRITSIRFETNCSDLVDMTTNPFICNCFGKRNWSKQSCMPYLENDEHVLRGRTAQEVWTSLRQLEFDEFFGVSFIPCTTWVDDPIDQTRVKQLEGVKTKFVVVAQANK
ncbi:hypothetical protein F2Q69_00002881 [Brassica cretica]|uniref:Uncharacterized protein n=1 Tax=Brassica cretica TaxID=69181 RepID=A0A8S9P1K5_BRACR|nr:hypothetical protein F2Q69_00002881 [Brassica cretica]